MKAIVVFTQKRLLGQKRRLPHKSTHNPTFEAKPIPT